MPSFSTVATLRRPWCSYVAKRMAFLRCGGLVWEWTGARLESGQGSFRAPGAEGDQTGGATKTPRSTSLKDSLATSSFIGFAVPHWSVTSGREKS